MPGALFLFVLKLFFFFFLIWTIFKVFTEFVTILLLFYVSIFWPREACGILAPRPGIAPATPALEGETLSTGLPGKSQQSNVIAIC